MRTARATVVVLCLLWAGIAIGISFIEAPVKFTAPSLTLAVGLDVGRRVFAASHAVQLVLAAAIAILAIAAGAGRRLPFAAFGVLLLQHVVLFPVLDARALAIIQGRPPSVPSPHVAYVVLEVIKIGILLAAAVVALRGPGATR